MGNTESSNSTVLSSSKAKRSTRNKNNLNQAGQQYATSQSTFAQCGALIQCGQPEFCIIPQNSQCINQCNNVAKNIAKIQKTAQNFRNKNNKVDDTSSYTVVVDFVPPSMLIETGNLTDAHHLHGDLVSKEVTAESDSKSKLLKLFPSYKGLNDGSVGCGNLGVIKMKNQFWSEFKIDQENDPGLNCTNGMQIGSGFNDSDYWNPEPSVIGVTKRDYTSFCVGRQDGFVDLYEIGYRQEVQDELNDNRNISKLNNQNNTTTSQSMTNSSQLQCTRFLSFKAHNLSPSGESVTALSSCFCPTQWKDQSSLGQIYCTTGGADGSLCLWELPWLGQSESFCDYHNIYDEEEQDPSTLDFLLRSKKELMKYRQEQSQNNCGPNGPSQSLRQPYPQYPQPQAKLIMRDQDAHPSSVTALDLAFFDQEAWILSGGTDGCLKLYKWDVSGNTQDSSQQENINSIDYGPNHFRLSDYTQAQLPIRGVSLDLLNPQIRCVSSTAKSVRIWDLQRMKAGCTFGVPQKVQNQGRIKPGGPSRVFYSTPKFECAGLKDQYQVEFVKVDEEEEEGDDVEVKENIVDNNDVDIPFGSDALTFQKAIGNTNINKRKQQDDQDNHTVNKMSLQKLNSKPNPIIEPPFDPNEHEIQSDTNHTQMGSDSGTDLDLQLQLGPAPQSPQQIGQQQQTRLKSTPEGLKTVNSSNLIENLHIRPSSELPHFSNSPVNRNRKKTKLRFRLDNSTVSDGPGPNSNNKSYIINENHVACGGHEFAVIYDTRKRDGLAILKEIEGVTIVNVEIHNRWLWAQSFSDLHYGWDLRM